MTKDNSSIEVDHKFIENFFGLINEPVPNDVSISDLNNVISNIKNKLSNIALSSVNSSALSGINPSIATTTTNSNKLKSVLIVDDLGIITYQLELLLKKLGFEVMVSNEIYDAIDKFKKQDFGYAIIDLFIPTDREGFILLDEIKKLSLLCKLNTKIIVITASSKPEYRIKCLNRGADSYIEKIAGWQDKIIEVCKD